MKFYTSLTTKLSKSGHHHPCSDPWFQGERCAPLELLWKRLEQLHEAWVHQGWVLASKGSQWIHRPRRVRPDEICMMDTESRLGQAEDVGFGQDP